MRKLLFYLLAVPMIGLLVACSSDDSSATVTLSAENLTEDGYFDGLLYYQIISNSSQEVAISKAGKNAMRVEIPKAVKIDGTPYKCTRIDDYAFYDCANLIYLSIPNSIVSIGERAFSGCI